MAREARGGTVFETTLLIKPPAVPEVSHYVEKMRAYGNAATSGSHNETFTVRDYDTSANANRAMAVRGNYFKIDSGNDTGSLFVQAYGGFIDNVTVENNYLRICFSQ